MSMNSKRSQDGPGNQLNRRSFLEIAGVGGAIGAAGAALSTPEGICRGNGGCGRPTDLIYHSATVLAEMIRQRQVSSEEVVEAHIARIGAVNPKINAVVQLLGEEALNRSRQADQALSRGEIRGPLHGVPVTVKDVCFLAGVVTSGGTLGRKDFVPTEDHPMVARMRRAGAIILGKTNAPELGLAHETDNLVYGRTDNPWDPTQIAGGSTGGEAALIAVGGSPLGIGGDGGGSIRSPAHFCGIAGLKPTWGMVSCVTHGITGGPAIGGYFVQGGPMARHVEDLDLALPILAGPSPGDPFTLPDPPVRDRKKVKLEDLRVAFFADNGIVKPTPATEETVRNAAKSLSAVASAVEEKRPPRIEETYDLFVSLILPGAADVFRQQLKMHGTEAFSPLMQQFLQLAGEYEDNWRTNGGLPDPEPRQVRWRTFNQGMVAFLSQHDVLLCPVNAYPAMKHGTTWDQVRAFSYVMTYNLTGHPAVVVRCGTSPEGLPIGVQIVGQHFREDVILAVAEYLEKSLGGWQVPPV